MGEAHGGVDGGPVDACGDAASAAEVRDDHAMRDGEVGRAHLLDDGLAAEAVEAVAANAALAIFGWDGVRGGDLGHGLVKDGVEAGEVRHIGEARHGLADDPDGGGIVQRREDDGFVEIVKDFIGDAHVAVEFFAGMDDAVAYGVDLWDVGLRDGFDDTSDGLDGVFGGDRGGWQLVFRIDGVECEGGMTGGDAVDLAFVERAWRAAAIGGEDGELDGGRSAVDDEQVHSSSRWSGFALLGGSGFERCRLFILTQKVDHSLIDAVSCGKAVSGPRHIAHDDVDAG